MSSGTKIDCGGSFPTQNISALTTHDSLPKTMVSVHLLPENDQACIRVNVLKKATAFDANLVHNGRSMLTFLSSWRNTQVVEKPHMRLFGA